MNKKTNNTHVRVCCLLLLLGALAQAAPIVFSASDSTPVGIQASIDAVHDGVGGTNVLPVDD